jgi:acetoin:2,6-dichlorophenolindophenol oxidoreductase subunit beta
MNTVQRSLNGALRTCLQMSRRIVVLGEDILDPYGGAFKVTRGLSTEFPEQVLATPVSEAGLIGVATGMALRGFRPVAEIMFGDFIALAADQLINHASKLSWISAGQHSIPLVVRTPMGGYRSYGPTHSQSLEKILIGVPGLRVVAANTLMDPGGMLQTAVTQEEEPLIFIEHKLLYPAVLPPADLAQEFELQAAGGRYPACRLIVRGAPPPVLTILTYGYMVELARRAARRLAYEHEVFVEVWAAAELSPDEEMAWMPAVQATGRLVTVEEGTQRLGWGAEIVSRAVERGSGRLRASRVAARNQPIPAAAGLESGVLPDETQIIEACLAMARTAA